MSASTRLERLNSPSLRITPVFLKTGPLVAGADAFERGRDVERLIDALPEIVAVVETAEWHAEYSPTGTATTRSALAALEAKLAKP